MEGLPFHEGELEAQSLAGLGSRGAGIREFMPDQHREFFGLLPYLFAAGRDEAGRPIATVLTGEDGFISSPSPTELAIAALPALHDPAGPALSPGDAIGLLGIDLRTRRRNRANGVIVARGEGGLRVAVSQSFGNCAKYIQSRQHQRAPALAEPAEAFSGLDEAARALIARADTLFIASAAAGGVDISHRGGQPGFVAIEGDRLTVPDFAGNNYFNTLGNLLLEPAAGLLFVDFAAGDVLQLQGETEIIWDGPELAALSGAQRLWRFRSRRGWRRRAALPLRWSAPELAPTTLATGIWRREACAAG
ncbi:pyridoxamine 5'-phosphate oxidase family protein [Bosea sp. (in: a-proteobacteria)]|uniref:pyridoxamine 5'-phosphate oxidase family protein n=1 Tax=Bosea sp. (in: a-proteobacteria) TaxID=1871050 RepID=UPI002FC6DCF1